MAFASTSISLQVCGTKMVILLKKALCLCKKRGKKVWPVVVAVAVSVVVNCEFQRVSLIHRQSVYSPHWLCYSYSISVMVDPEKTFIFAVEIRHKFQQKNTG